MMKFDLTAMRKKLREQNSMGLLYKGIIIVLVLVIIGLMGNKLLVAASQTRSLEKQKQEQDAKIEELKRKEAEVKNNVPATTPTPSATEPTTSASTDTTTTTIPTNTPTITPKPCDAGAKLTALNNENYQYQQLIIQENTYFNTEYAKWVAQRDGSCGGKYQNDAVCENAKYWLNQESDRHAAKLKELETQHSTNLANINSTCY